MGEMNGRLHDEIVELAGIGHWELNHTTGRLYWCDQIYRLFKVSKENFPATYEAFLGLIHEADRASVHKAYTAHITKGIPYDIQHRVQRPDGSSIWVQERCKTEFDENHKPLRSIGVVMDITELKAAEELARKNEERFRLLLETSLDGICVVDMKGRFIYVNKGAVAISGYTLSELYSMNVNDVIAPQYQEDFARRFQNRQSGDAQAYLYESAIVHKNCQIVPIEISSVGLQEQGVVTGILSIFRDISERKKLLTSLQESHQILQEIMDSITDGLYLIGDDHRIIKANNAMKHWYSHQMPLEGKKCHEVFTNSPTPCDACPVRQVRETGYISSGYTRRTISAGIERLFHISSYPVKEKNGTIKKFVQILRDVTRQKQMEELLKASEERHKNIFDHVPVGIAYYNRDLILEFCNDKFIELLQTSPKKIKNLNLRTLNDQRILPCLRMPFAGENGEYEGWYESTTSGKKLYISMKTAPIYNTNGEITSAIWLLQDMTQDYLAEQEKLKMERQLQHVQRLESLGVLAGGIAHDFNNLLMVIMGNVELTQRKLPPLSPASENLQNILKASEKAADLCKQMLAYSGKGKFVVQHLDISELIKDMSYLLEVSIPKQVKLRYEFADDLPPIEGDAAQINQIIMNLITNAAESIGDRSGIITIRTGIMHCERAYLKETWLDEDLPEGPYCYYEVADTGCGMTDEVKARIFDPFFTTKFTGRGLGMSAVLGIVRGHKGAIKLYSEPGRGSIIKVLFPAVMNAVTQKMKKENHTLEDFQDTGTILLVDDEETIRSLGKEILSAFGFSVMMAENGREALEIFMKESKRIDLVILDLMMPHMDGADCFRELKRIKPDVKVIMSSGYNEQEITQRFVGKGLAGFLQKPYQMQGLINMIRKVLKRSK
ncbi:MAG: PAS domain S-box protein [Dissulfuribacterales bacterium]